MINNVTLIGRLGKDPEQRQLPNGTNYCRFSIATSESYKDKEGNWQDSTEWHNIVLWRDMSERACNALKKGDLVYIEGKLTYRSWQDENGNTKNMTEVVGRLYRKLEKRGDNIPAPIEPQGNENSNNDSSDSSDDDLPF